MTSDDESRKVYWYRLFESSTGLADRNTRLSKVSVSINADVDDFRTAVYAENSSILDGITSSQLIVYKNIDAFEKRNANEDKWGPLDEDSLVNDDLGKTTKEALIVAVSPVDVRTPLHSTSFQEPNVFPANTTAFQLTNEGNALDVSSKLYNYITSPLDTELSLEELPALLLTDPSTQFPLHPDLYVRLIRKGENVGRILNLKNSVIWKDYFFPYYIWM